jgi:para-nitrobenzyl esterase
MKNAVLWSLLGASVLVGQSATAQGAAAQQVVRTKSGPVRGETVSEGAYSARIFRGIPYAAPPVGALRWKAPQPVAAWTQVRDATQWPNRCPQGASNMGVAAPISEDCLYLNVVVPARAGGRLPVMVFYHGGGLTTGTGNSTTYNHPRLPNQGVIVVTVNSRLGPFGYMAHPALAAEGRGSGNYGTLDIRQSLEWVRDNIAAFGGDPRNVTIFGESGGGAKVTSQLASPLSRGLFHRAVVQSGSALVTAQRSTSREAAEARGQAVAQALNAPQGAGALAAMRAAKWEDVLAAANTSRFTAGVVVDGDVIPAPIHELFAQGKQNKVPLIVGANEGESSLTSDVPEMARLHSAAGNPTWVYNFSQLPLGWRRETGCVAFHGLELAYVFGAIPQGLVSPTTQGLARGGGCSVRPPEHDAQDVAVSDNASRIWAQFARTGNPSVPGLIEWPRYTAAGKAYLDIAAPLEVKRGVEAAYVAPPTGAQRVPGTPAP